MIKTWIDKVKKVNNDKKCINDEENVLIIKKMN